MRRLKGPVNFLHHRAFFPESFGGECPGYRYSFKELTGPCIVGKLLNALYRRIVFFGDIVGKAWTVECRPLVDYEAWRQLPVVDRRVFSEVRPFVGLRVFFPVAEL